MIEKRLEINCRTSRDDMDIGGNERNKKEEEGGGGYVEEYDEWGYPIDINGIGKGFEDLWKVSWHWSLVDGSRAFIRDFGKSLANYL